MCSYSLEQNHCLKWQFLTLTNLNINIGQNCSLNNPISISEKVSRCFKFWCKVFRHKMSPLNLNFGSSRLSQLSCFQHIESFQLWVQSRLWHQTPQAPVSKKYTNTQIRKYTNTQIHRCMATDFPGN